MFWTHPQIAFLLPFLFSYTVTLLKNPSSLKKLKIQHEDIPILMADMVFPQPTGHM